MNVHLNLHEMIVNKTITQNSSIKVLILLLSYTCDSFVNQFEQFSYIFNKIFILDSNLFLPLAPLLPYFSKITFSPLRTP